MLSNVNSAGRPATHACCASRKRHSGTLLPAGYMTKFNPGVCIADNQDAAECRLITSVQCACQNTDMDANGGSLAFWTSSDK